MSLNTTQRVLPTAGLGVGFYRLNEIRQLSILWLWAINAEDRMAKCTYLDQDKLEEKFL